MNACVRLGSRSVHLASWRCRGKRSLFQGFARPPSPPTLLHYFWERVFFGLPSITKPTILRLVFRRCLSASRPEPESFPLPTSPSSLPYPAAVPKICLGGFTRSGYCRCFIVSRLGKAAHDTDNITGQPNRRLCSPDGQSRPIFRNALRESGGLPTLKACKEPLYGVHFISSRRAVFQNLASASKTKRDRATATPWACPARPSPASTYKPAP